ncbi:hypothetical protein AgCh_019969 [Apium graveolens]
MPKIAMVETGKMKEGTIGLSYPMLNRGNYTTWAIKMKVYMEAQEVWSAIDSTGSTTVIEEMTDKVALAAIYQGIPEDILLAVSEKKTTKEA